MPTLMLVLVAIMVLAGCTSDSSNPVSTTAPSDTTSADAGSTSTETSVTTSTTAGGLRSGPGTGVETEAKRLSPDSGHFAICPDCHAYLDPPARPRPALTDAFGHENHLARSAPCTACHDIPVHTPTVVRRPTMAACYRCHGEGPSATASGDCSVCHPPDFDRLPASHDEAFYKGAHAAVVVARGTDDCFVCHQGGETGFCRACHGLDLPHPPGWALDPDGGPGSHVNAAHEDASVCVRCHQNGGLAPAGCYGGECHGS